MEETISQYIELVLQREPISGEAEGWALLVDNGELTLDQVRQSIIDSAEASTDVYPVILAYQAIYGRVPDAGGLNYWVNVYRGVQDLDDPSTPTQNEAMVALLRPFVDPEQTAEFVDRFGPNPTADQFITLSYLNVLGRTPDTEGQLYWTNRYNQVLSELEAANPDWSTEQLNVEVRAILLEQFVSSQEYAQSAAAAIDGFLNAAALGEEGAYEGSLWSFSGDTFTLTTDADNYAGTDGNDTFNAPLSSGAGGLVAQQTLQGFDTLDGGKGNDTLNAELNGFDALFGAHDPKISNIEQYNLTVRAEGAEGGLDLANASGYEVLQNVDSRGDLYLFNANLLEDGDAPEIALTNVRGDTEVYYDDEVDSVSVQNVTANKVGLHDDDAYLSIDVDNGGIETLNLAVSNGVYLDLDGDADLIQNLIISGSGVLELEGDTHFQNLVTLNSTNYLGNLNLDVSGSEVLVNVETGEGHDRIVVDNDVVNGGLAVNMNEGENVLAVETDNVNGFNQTRIGNLDFTGGVENVQTLELTDDVNLNNNATLDLDGFDDALATLSVTDFDANGNVFTIVTAPEDFLITASDDFDMEGGVFAIEGTVNLTVESTGTGNSDVSLDGGVVSTTLETLVINAADDAELVASGGLDALTSIEVNAGPNTSFNPDAEVTLNNTNGEEFGALKKVTVSAVNDADLTMNGRMPVHQVQTFTAGALGIGGAFIAFDFPGVGIVGGSDGGSISFSNMIADLNANLASAGSEYSAAYIGGEIVFTRSDPGPAPEITLDTFTVGGLAVGGVSNNGITTPGVDGAGFESLENVVVSAADDADVELTDVYGAFNLEVTAADDAYVDLTRTGAATVDVTAGDDAFIDLDSTGVTSVTVTAADYVDIDVEGIYGNDSLTTITVTSAAANITLEDSMSSFETLDVSGVSTNLTVDTSGADFEVGTGMYVEYLLGDTVTVNFTGNDVREVYTFDGTDIGAVTIYDFMEGADPTNGDRLDLSAFGFTGAGDLIFDDSGPNVVITDLGGDDFSGSITLIGVANVEDLAFNIIYA